MLRTIYRRFRKREDGQALAIFAGGLLIFLGLMAMSIDVGRFVWARTQMQAAVDAAALAAAQSMPDQSDASVKANDYWLDNSSFIRGQGTNVQFSVTYPPGNKRISIRGEADIPTWFAKFFGIDHWHVSAEGDAESQVLDIAVVLDISGSMCWNTYPSVESSAGTYVGPGRTADVVTLTQAIPSGGGDTITIYVNSVAIFNSTSSSFNNSKFGFSTSTRYYQYTPSPGRQGLIMIGNELMQITGLSTVNNTLTVTRGRTNNFTGQVTAKDTHPSGSEVFSQHTNCYYAAYATSGPFQPYDGMVDDAQYFVTLFNSAYDKLGLASFSSNAALRRSLTNNFAQLNSDLDALVKPDGGTNSAHGIAVGRQILDGTGKRANSVRVLVFLTDGRANGYCGSTYSPSSYNSTSCPSQGSGADGNATAVYAAYQETIRAVNGQIIVFTIGLGNSVDDNFLKRVADGGVSGVGPCQQVLPGCRYFKAPTLAELDDAFQSIAEQTHIALVR